MGRMLGKLRITQKKKKRCVILTRTSLASKPKEMSGTKNRSASILIDWFSGRKQRQYVDTSRLWPLTVQQSSKSPDVSETMEHYDSGYSGEVFADGWGVPGGVGFELGLQLFSLALADFDQQGPLAELIG